jgi:hypothetical protein
MTRWYSPRTFRMVVDFLAYIGAAEAQDSK